MENQNKIEERPGLETIENVASNTTTPVKGGQLRMETWWMLGLLVVALIILKSFIYIKDPKRDGK